MAAPEAFSHRQRWGLPWAARLGNSRCPVAFATVVAGAASACSCFRCRCGVERQVDQHVALATFVDQVGPGLVVVFPDGRHDGDGGSADPAVAGPAGAAHPVWLVFLRVVPGTCTGATERLLHCSVGNSSVGGVGGCPWPRGAGMRVIPCCDLDVAEQACATVFRRPAGRRSMNLTGLLCRMGGVR